MVRKSSDKLLAVLAENIKSFRREKGFSQEELAEQCGLHRTYIGSVEREERNVTLSTLEALAQSLGVLVPDLLTKHGSTRVSALHREADDTAEALRHLTPAQKKWMQSIIHAFGATCRFVRAKDSDVVTPAVLSSFGDRLLSHHANSRQALSKDRFEFALEAVLNSSGITAQLVTSRTNRGHHPRGSG
jgi:transcriptional regulator with XRE-family HTH domain